MQCPKCHAPMHTYNRNGVQIEQCSGCRGIFLDYGELEALTRLEAPDQETSLALAGPMPWDTVTPAPAGGPTVGQQWWVVSGRTADGAATGTYRLVNRYSGLVIGLSARPSRPAETAPARFWQDTGGSAVGGSRTAAEQTLTLTPTGPAPRH